MKTFLLIIGGFIIAALLVILGEIINVKIKCENIYNMVDEINVRTMKQGIIGEAVK